MVLRRSDSNFCSLFFHSVTVCQVCVTFVSYAYGIGLSSKLLKNGSLGKQQQDLKSQPWCCRTSSQIVKQSGTSWKGPSEYFFFKLAFPERFPLTEKKQILKSFSVVFVVLQIFFSTYKTSLKYGGGNMWRHFLIGM